MAIQSGSEEALIAHRPNQLPRETAVTVALLNDRDQLVFNEGAGARADEKLTLRKEGIEFDEINALEPECHCRILVENDILLLLNCVSRVNRVRLGTNSVRLKV
jgi:hypothetical protein